jgi:hypothetical protein
LASPKSRTKQNETTANIDVCKRRKIHFLAGICRKQKTQNSLTADLLNFTFTCNCHLRCGRDSIRQPTEKFNPDSSLAITLPFTIAQNKMPGLSTRHLIYLISGEGGIRTFSSTHKQPIDNQIIAICKKLHHISGLLKYLQFI